MTLTIAIASITIDKAPNSGTMEAPMIVSNFESSGIEMEMVFRSLSLKCS
jgi:hypothetical protein